jgi:polysaccharide export outer membrane protein
MGMTKERIMRRRLAVLALGLIGVLAAAPVGAAAEPTATPATQAGDWQRDYRLGAGDKLHVTVFNEPNLTGDFSVSDAGDLSFPLLGRMPVAGLTVDQFETMLREQLGQSLQRPEVAAEILTYRPFYILGEVQRPGQYPFAAGMTIMGAVATAGGFTYRANAKTVLVRRSGGKLEEPARANSEALVLPGDTIRVKERWF